MTVSRNPDLLGTTYIAYSLFTASVLAVTAAILVGAGALSPDLPLSEVGPAAGLAMLIGLAAATPFAIVGRALQHRRSWARTAGIVLALMIVGSFPIGTALGAFALVTLLDRDVKAQFQA